MNPARQEQPKNVLATRCILWGGYAEGNTGDKLTLAAAQDFPRSQALSRPEMNAVDAVNAMLKAAWSKS
jgi:hypothetical protein